MDLRLQHGSEHGGSSSGGCGRSTRLSIRRTSGALARRGRREAHGEREQRGRREHGGRRLERVRIAQLGVVDRSRAGPCSIARDDEREHPAPRSRSPAATARSAASRARESTRGLRGAPPGRGARCGSTARARRPRARSALPRSRRRSAGRAPAGGSRRAAGNPSRRRRPRAAWRPATASSRPSRRRESAPGRERAAERLRELRHLDPGLRARRRTSPPPAGAKTTSTPAPRHSARSRLERARIGREVPGVLELRRVHEDREPDAVGPAPAPRRPARGVPRAAPPSWAPAPCAARRRAPRRPAPGARATVVSTRTRTSPVGVLRRRGTSRSPPRRRSARAAWTAERAEVRVLLDEARRPSREPEQVVHHQHLAVAVDPGADADGRNRRARA